jgi:hypothetical protein
MKRKNNNNKRKTNPWEECLKLEINNQENGK